MQSDHLTEPEPESRLHFRETAAQHVNLDGGASTNSNGNGGPVIVEGPTHSRTTKRSRPSKSSFWDRTSGGGHVRIPINDNFAKYNKRRVRRHRQLKRYTIGFICLGSFILGFIWRRHFAHDANHPDLVVRPQLRHPSDTVKQWKPRTAGTTTPKKSRADFYSDGRKQINKKNDNIRSSNKLSIPRFDTRRYLQWWNSNANNAATHKHPKTYSIEGWDAPVAFRSFPYARQTHGPIKNVDSDYGELTYHSVKNEEVFARVVNAREAMGGFDPDSIQPEQSLKKRNQKRKASGAYPNYDSRGRKILQDDASYEELKNYYNDDSVHVWKKANDGKTRDPRACQDTEVSAYYFPTCNNFHERYVGRLFDDPTTLVNQRPENELYVKYLAHGYYRDVWVLEDSPWIWPTRYPREKEQQSIVYEGILDKDRTSEMVTKAYRSMVLKTLQMRHPFNDEQFEEVQLEAIIMERMTKSPRIMGIYGHCAYSTMAEVVPIEFEERAVPGEGYESQKSVEKRNTDGIRPYNNFTSTQKLVFALEMAESLADLHGFEDGVIVHDDVQLCQWLHTPNGRLKLGDFNRATIMQWDTIKGEYCKFNNGEAFANYRAPEEFAVRNLVRTI